MYQKAFLKNSLKSFVNSKLYEAKVAIFEKLFIIPVPNIYRIKSSDVAEL